MKWRYHARTQEPLSLTQRLFVCSYYNTLAGQYDRLAEFVSESSVVQHSPEIGDGIEALDPALRAVTYQRTYNVIGSGNFVAALSQVDHLTRY